MEASEERPGSPGVVLKEAAWDVVRVDDPCRLLSWANTALIERAGVSVSFVTAACVTFLPSKQILRWAYAGHPPRSGWMTVTS